MSSNDNTRADLNRRVIPNVPDGEQILVEECLSVYERLKAFGIVDAPSIAVLPRNFDSARCAADFVTERSAADIRVVGRRAGVNVSTFQGMGGREIHENDAHTIGAVIWISLEAFNNVGTLIEFMKELGSLVQRRSRGVPNAELEVVQEFVVGDERHSKRFVYRGPASTLEKIVPVMLENILPATGHDSPAHMAEPIAKPSPLPSSKSDDATEV